MVSIRCTRLSYIGCTFASENYSCLCELHDQYRVASCSAFSVFWYWCVCVGLSFSLLGKITMFLCPLIGSWKLRLCADVLVGCAASMWWHL